MKPNTLFGFVLSLIATAWILHLLAYNEKKVSLLSLERRLDDETWIKKQVGDHCGSLSPLEASTDEERLLPRLSPDFANPNAPSCTVKIRDSMRHRFHLLAYWTYGIQISVRGERPFLEETYPLTFPRPLCFLPIAAFLLALVFEIPFWGLALTVTTYLLLVAGGNITQALSLAANSTLLTFSTDLTFLGLLLMGLWLALFCTKAPPKRTGRRPRSRWEYLASRALTLLVGIWNPGAYALLGRLLYPMKSRLIRLRVFLDAQVLVAAFSLYLLNLDQHHLWTFIGGSFFLPRYFTFSAGLFVLVGFFVTKSRPEPIVWRLPQAWRAPIFIVAMELLAWKIPLLGRWPTVLRVGAALVLSEICFPMALDLPRAIKTFLPWVSALFLASFISVVSVRTGIIDLFQVLVEPRVHPVGLVLFTFIAGLVLGFLTGNFSATFFALFPVILQPHQSDLVKAALLDGILAGNLLSPFSIINLLPAAQFGESLHEVMIFRFKQLGFPLAIAVVIYTVSAINSVAILRPATFIFLCLIALAFQLKKSAWKLGRFSIEAPVSG